MKQEPQYVNKTEFPDPEIEQIVAIFNDMLEKYSKELLCATMLHFIIYFSIHKEFFLNMCNVSWDVYKLSDCEPNQTVKTKSLIDDIKTKRESEEYIIKKCKEIFDKQNKENIPGALISLICGLGIKKEVILSLIEFSFDFNEGNL